MRQARSVRAWWREMARYDTWNVGIVSLPAPLGDVLELPALLRTVTWLPAQRPLYFIADPFPFRFADRDWLLVEDYGHPWGVRGRISRIDVRDPRATLAPVIDRPIHLSYPYTLTDRGRVYCVPETSQERRGCVFFELLSDGSWAERHRILADRVIVDPTLVQFDGRWWLLCGNAEGHGSLELDAYYADAIDGPWTPHARNPLKRDRATARPGGRPFAIGGQWYRPAQDCSRTYGGALTIMAIDELTPSVFREHPVVRLEPDPDGPYPDGLHHLVVDRDRIYMDGKRQRYDSWLWLKRWRSMIESR